MQTKSIPVQKNLIQIKDKKNSQQEKVEIRTQLSKSLHKNEEKEIKFDIENTS